MVDGWPSEVDCSNALQDWNWKPKYNKLENILDEHGNGDFSNTHGETFKKYLLNLGINDRKISEKKGVIIGNNVWIGANCCIVAGVTIGNNVTIGAGCAIRENIPSNSLVIQTTNTIVIKEKKAYQWDCTKEELL